MLRRLLQIGLCAVFSLLPFSARAASEHIVSFHSDIEVRADATMEVVETIKVVANGNRIKRGIYRDFPTQYKDRFGNDVRVQFKVIGVERDGKHEKWREVACS